MRSFRGSAKGLCVLAKGNLDRSIHSHDGAPGRASSSAPLALVLAVMSLAGCAGAESTGSSADTSAPTAPTGVTCHLVANQIDLFWDPARDNVAVAGYRVYRDGLQIATTDAPSYSDLAPRTNVAQVYTVSAYDAAGNQSGPSDQCSVLIDTIPPSAPTDLVVSRLNSDISLTWATSSDNVGVSRYLIVRDGQPLDTSSSPSFVDAFAPTNVEHCYTVKASDAGGNVSTPSGSSCILVDTAPPEAPGGVSVRAYVARLDVTWVPASDNVGVSTYRVYRDSIFVNETANLSFSDGAVSPGVTYCYEIAAQDSAQNLSSRSSPACNALDVTPPSVPSNVIGTAVSTSRIDVSWTESTDNATGVSGYSIFRDGTRVADASTASYSDPALAAGTSYCYSVTATDYAGSTSAPSIPVCLKTKAWPRKFGGSSDDAFNAIAQTPDGGYILAGSTSSSGAGGTDIFVVKVTADGSLTWHKTWGGTSNDQASAIVVAPGGGFIVGGLYYSDPSGKYGYLAKLSDSGDLVWSKTYVGTSVESIAMTRDGGFVLGGLVNSNAGLLIRTDADGNELWRKSFGATGEARVFYSVIEASDLGIVAAGSRYPVPQAGMFVVKTDSVGTLLWEKTIGGSTETRAWAIGETSDGGYAIAGETQLPYPVSGEAYVVKTSSSGTVVWSHTYGSNGYDTATAFAVTSDGGFVLAGYAESGGASGTMRVLKADESGTVAWSKILGGPDAMVPYSLIQSTDAGYTLAGKVMNSGLSENVDAFALHLDATGTVQ